MLKKFGAGGIMLAGIIVGAIASLLVYFGNPANMGFCNACFLRDVTGALGLHKAAAVQYLRPEIFGLVLGSFLLAFFNKEFLPRGGSSPLTRFILGFFVMIGCLMFLGCPFRMILRLAGGDLNAIFGLVGFVCGILAGVVFLKKGYTLGRTYKLSKLEGLSFPLVQLALLALLVSAPAFIYFSEKGPGSQHAPLLISLCAGLIVGAVVQRSRLCMVGGVRDLVLFREWKLLAGLLAVLVSALAVNLVMTGAGLGNFFKLGFEAQPIAHSDGLWNFLGMLLAGFGSVLLGGCPLRQLVLSGEGNIDSALTVLGLIFGAAIAHNFGLAASGTGPSDAGKIAVMIGVVVVSLIAVANTVRAQKA